MLQTGKYLPDPTLIVKVWRKADVNGDGPEVWEDTKDGEGRVVGRDYKRDQNNNVVRSYTPPEGFRNIRSSDGNDCWVFCDEKDAVHRQPNGEAVNIREGQAVVLYADGSASVLNDEYEQYLFEKAHTSTGEDKAAAKSKSKE